MGQELGLARGGAFACGVLVLCVGAMVSACSNSERSCPQPGRVPGHPGDYLASDLTEANAVDCGLVGKVARQGDLA